MLESNTLYLHIIYGRSLDSYLFRSFLIPYDLDLVRQLNVFLVIVLREIPPLPDYTNIYLTSWSMLYIEQWTALCHSSLNILAIIQTSACLTRGICMSTRIQHYTDVTWTTWCIKSQLNSSRDCSYRHQTRYQSSVLLDFSWWNLLGFKSHGVPIMQKQFPCHGVIKVKSALQWRHNGPDGQITSLTIVYSIFYSGADQRKHQRSASLAFVRGIHQSSVNSPHKRPVTLGMFPFDDVIMAIFLSNSQFNEVLQSGHNIFSQSQRNFAHVTTVIMLWRVQNFFVISSAHFKLEHGKMKYR